MSNLDVPPFDLLDQQAVPYKGFGPTLEESEERELVVLSMIDASLERLHQGFGIDISDITRVPQEIDKVIDTMWKQGWRPSSGNLNLFTTDFGLALLGSLIKKYGGRIVLRSASELNHLSLHWNRERKEAFPFHHVLKALTNPEANSVSAFYDGVGSLLGEGT